MFLMIWPKRVRMWPIRELCVYWKFGVQLTFITLLTFHVEVQADTGEPNLALNKMSSTRISSTDQHTMYTQYTDGNTGSCHSISDARNLSWVTILDPVHSYEIGKIDLVVAFPGTYVDNDVKILTSFSSNRDEYKSCINSSLNSSGLNSFVCDSARNASIVHVRITSRSAVELCEIMIYEAVNGQWGSWSSWTSCSVTCSAGHIYRTRLCESPTPRYGGHDCPNSDVDEDVCFKDPCIVDGGWSDWIRGPCSTSCGEGVELRKRTCTNPIPHHGRPCQGEDSLIEPCNVRDCPVDGQWGPWTTTPCSVSCGLGTQNYTRRCDSPAPEVNGTNCHGESLEVMLCWGTCPVEVNIPIVSIAIIIAAIVVAAWFIRRRRHRASLLTEELDKQEDDKTDDRTAEQPEQRKTGRKSSRPWEQMSLRSSIDSAGSAISAFADDILSRRSSKSSAGRSSGTRILKWLRKDKSATSASGDASSMADADTATVADTAAYVFTESSESYNWYETDEPENVA